MGTNGDSEKDGQKESSKGGKKIGAVVAPDHEDSLNPPRSWDGVGDVNDTEERPPRLFEGITDVTARRQLSEIGVRNILAYCVILFFLLCMGAFIGYMIVRADTAGLTSGISILVGMVGLVIGYYFGKEEERQN